MDRSLWIKAAAAGQQQNAQPQQVAAPPAQHAAAPAQQQPTNGGSFDWSDWAAPAIGGLIGAGAASLFSDDDEEEEEIIYDRYGRPIGRRASGGGGGVGNALLGGLAGAAAGLGYNAIKGNTMGEKWNTVKNFFSGDSSDKGKQQQPQQPKQPALTFSKVDRNGKPLSDTSVFSQNVMGAQITGHGVLNDEKLRGYQSPDYYMQQLYTAAMNKEKGGGFQYYSPLLKQTEEEFMANGLDPEDAYTKQAMEQMALLKFDRQYFANRYRMAIEEAYGMPDGSLTPYMPDLTAQYQQELMNRQNQVPNAGAVQ